MRSIAVLAHGCGSRADFVRRAFAEPLETVGYALLALEDRSGDIDQVTADLLAAVDRSRASIVGGVSLGAHAAARVAAARPELAGALLVLPAWTGPPGATAALSAWSAEQVSAEGLDRAVRRVAGSGWVGDELAAAWPGYGGTGLVRALRATAASAGPSRQLLRTLRVPAGVVALRDDPFHPATVARRWARLIPSAALRVLPGDAPAADRAALGRAAVAAWTTAVSGSR